MKHPCISALHGLINRYDRFAEIAERLQWVPAQAEHFDLSEYRREMYLRLHLIKFPAGYAAAHPAETIVHTLLAAMGSNEEWEPNFWEALSPEERRHCLSAGRDFYGEYACYEACKMQGMTPQEFRDDLLSWYHPKNAGNLAALESVLAQLQTAETILLGSSGYAPDASWITFSGDTVLFTGFHASG